MALGPKGLDDSLVGQPEQKLSTSRQTSETDKQTQMQKGHGRGQAAAAVSFLLDHRTEVSFRVFSSSGRIQPTPSSAAVAVANVMSHVELTEHGHVPQRVPSRELLCSGLSTKCK